MLLRSIYIRNVYTLIHPKALAPAAAKSRTALSLQIGRMDVPREVDDEWNTWYNTIYVPNYAKVPGVIRGRRYRALTGTPSYLTFNGSSTQGLGESGLERPARRLPGERAHAHPHRATPRARRACPSRLSSCDQLPAGRWEVTGCQALAITSDHLRPGPCVTH